MMCRRKKKGQIMMEPRHLLLAVASHVFAGREVVTRQHKDLSEWWLLSKLL